MAKPGLYSNIAAAFKASAKTAKKPPKKGK